MPTPDQWETQIIVTDMKVISSGTNKKTNAPFTLYQIEAAKPNGQRIDNLKLRTFQELPKHEVIDVRIKRFVSEQYGESFTIERKGKSKTQERMDELESRVKALEALASKVSNLEVRLTAIEDGVVRPAQPPVTPVQAPPPPAPAAQALPPITPETYGQPPATVQEAAQAMQRAAGIPTDDDIPF